MNVKKFALVRIATAIGLLAVLLLSSASPAYAASRVGSVTVSAQAGTLTYGTPASATYNVVVTSTNNRSGTVTLKVAGLPTGATASFNPASLAFTGIQSKTTVLTVTTNNLTPAAVTTLSVTATGSTTKTATGTLTVGQRAATVTANNRSKVYGDALTFAGTEFLAVGLVNSDKVNSATLTSSGAPATAAVSGSPYPIVPSAAVGSGLSNYLIQYVAGSLTVTPRTLTVTANNRSKVYGDVTTFAGTEFVPTGLVNGDTVTSVTLTSSGTVATAAVAGSPYQIVPSAAVGTGLSNYSIQYAAGNLTVTQRAATITASDLSKVYGDVTTFAGTEFLATGFINGDAATSVTLTSLGASATATVAGSPYPITPSAATGSGLGNYAIQYVPGSLTVTQRAATITASNLSKVYGDVTTFAGTEFVPAGFINSDAVTSVTLTSNGAPETAAVAGSPYPIVPSAATGSGLGNYAIQYVAGTLTITSKTLTVTGVTANDKVYDGNTTASVNAGSATLSGIVGSDAVTLGTSSVSGAFAGPDVGLQNVQVSGLSISGTAAANYSLEQPSTTATITPAPAVINARPAFKVTGYPDPDFGFSGSGFVNGENASVLTAQPTCGVTLTPHDAAGTYTVSCTGASAHNYTFTYVDAAFVVDPGDSVPTDINLSKLSVAEKLNAGAAVGDLTTVDGDSVKGETYQYTLVNGGAGCEGADNASFTIPGYFSGGPVPLQTAAQFSYATKHSYSICIQTNDGFGGTFNKAFTVSVMPSTITLTSNGMYDGWVLESSENGRLGSKMDGKSTTLRVGDDAARRQYVSILSFNTAALGPNAHIYGVKVRVMQQGRSGAANIATQLLGLRLDIKKLSFGLPALQSTDFQAPVATSGKVNVARFGVLSGGWYAASVPATAYRYVNLTGSTQFRLHFYKDDNNNSQADYLSLYSGNAVTSYRPQLIITYSTP
ncbi:MAG TPA: MBG domain-containing protein [Anaerolineales bacterium]|nr:MBG domain-containing protein [Anaerolineales bacterium]